jgi:hypothetical protein
MQGVQTVSKHDFSYVAANANTRPRINILHKQHMLAAYGIGSKLNDWHDYIATFEDDFFSVTTFQANYRPHRAITVFKYPERDNHGCRFLIQTFGRQSYLRTNSFKHALNRFKKPEAKLDLVP